MKLFPLFCQIIHNFAGIFALRLFQILSRPFNLVKHKIVLCIHTEFVKINTLRDKVYGDTFYKTVLLEVTE
jgi:hypothetical protein